MDTQVELDLSEQGVEEQMKKATLFRFATLLTLLTLPALYLWINCKRSTKEYHYAEHSESRGCIDRNSRSLQ